ncbi:SGNH hydrolase domain-containing protein [Kocuria marina]|uniref:SGNH hydrolase domain-containing protein n=1 Tax=Kocuria marina TaxID=223184 RepID=UPI002989A3B9|nr:SGNH hydrolase domain-containing protein [Kocuria marina]
MGTGGAATQPSTGGERVREQPWRRRPAAGLRVPRRPDRARAAAPRGTAPQRRKPGRGLSRGRRAAQAVPAVLPRARGHGGPRPHRADDRQQPHAALGPRARTAGPANGWRVLAFIQHGCSYTVAAELEDAEACATWFEGSDEMLAAADPNLVFVQGTFSEPDGETWKPGLETRVRALVADGIQVVGIRDTPRFHDAPAECAALRGLESPECEIVHPMLDTPDPQRDLGSKLEGFAPVDMTDVVCPDGACRPAVGNMIVYFDDDHLTGMYAASASHSFAQRVSDALQQDGITGIALPE